METNGRADSGQCWVAQRLFCRFNCLKPCPTRWVALTRLLARGCACANLCPMHDGRGSRLRWLETRPRRRLSMSWPSAQRVSCRGWVHGLGVDCIGGEVCCGLPCFDMVMTWHGLACKKLDWHANPPQPLSRHQMEMGHVCRTTRSSPHEHHLLLCLVWAVAPSSQASACTPANDGCPPTTP